MATDCEKFSEKAQKIYEKLQSYYPPNSFNNTMWYVDGVIRHNHTYDLRKSADRDRLINLTTLMLGELVKNEAGGHHVKNGSLSGFEIEHFGLMIKQQAELLLTLHQLDVQIETMDFLDELEGASQTQPKTSP